MRWPSGDPAFPLEAAVLRSDPPVTVLHLRKPTYEHLPERLDQCDGHVPPRLWLREGQESGAYHCPMSERRIDGVTVVLWHDWYDGYLSGVAAYAGNLFWFEAEGAQDESFVLDPNKRRLMLFPITEDELRHEQEIDRLFQQHVHGKPEADLDAFWQSESTRPPRPYTGRACAGWFIAGTPSPPSAA